MTTYEYQLTQQLRNAHIQNLKQTYLDLIEEANRRKRRSDLEYEQLTNEAYIEKRRDLRDRPQQLRALGLGGGRGDEDLAAILTEYADRMQTLQRSMQDSIAEFEYTVEKQTQRMNNALQEYNARIALEDYKTAAAASKSASKSSGGRSSKSASSPPVKPVNESKVINEGSGGSVPTVDYSTIRPRSEPARQTNYLKPYDKKSIR